jgi:tRNA (cmo5U34)-methyltransferase
VGQFHFKPEGYRELIREEVPAYDELQEQVARATAGVDARRVLDLGAGTGETARRVLQLHGEARLVGIDVSPEMLERAGSELPAERVESLRVAGLADPLPEGPFELVVSALAVHHLDGPGKADLFRRVAAVLAPGGRFVLGDVVVPDRPEDVVTPCTPGYDFPDRVDDQLDWLRDAGFQARVEWADRDLAVVSAQIPSGDPAPTDSRATRTTYRPTA